MITTKLSGRLATEAAKGLGFWERLDALRAETESLQAAAKDSELRDELERISDTLSAYLGGA